MLKNIYKIVAILVILSFFLSLYHKDYPWALFCIIFLGTIIEQRMEKWKKRPLEKILYFFSWSAYVLSALLFVFKNEARISAFTHSPFVLAIPLCFFLPHVYFLWKQKSR